MSQLHHRNIKISLDKTPPLQVQGDLPKTKMEQASCSRRKPPKFPPESEVSASNNHESEIHFEMRMWDTKAAINKCIKGCRDIKRLCNPRRNLLVLFCAALVAIHTTVLVARKFDRNLIPEPNISLDDIAIKNSSFYPWYSHQFRLSATKSSNSSESLLREEILKKWDLEQMFEQMYAIQNDSLSSAYHCPKDFLIKEPLVYVLYEGKLHAPKAQHKGIIAANRECGYYDRIKKSEVLMSWSLKLAAANHQKGRKSSEHNTIGSSASSEGHYRNETRNQSPIFSTPIPFLFDFGDFVSCMGRKYPFFTYSMGAPGTLDTVTGCVPLAFPSYEEVFAHIYQNAKTQALWESRFRKQNRDFPWERKISKAVWRGSTTGRRAWRELPRTKLVRMGLENPDLLDVAFSKVVQYNETVAAEIGNELPVGFRHRMRFQNFMNYRAVIDIDGNSWSSRFSNLLCMNSVVVQVEPTMVDYFYAELKPWVHYVPVYANLSNLVERIEYVVSDDNQKQMQGIVQSANEWCKSRITYAEMIADMLLIFESYIDLLNMPSTRDNQKQLLSKWQDRFRLETVSSDSKWVVV